MSAPELGLQKAPAKYPGTLTFHARALPWVEHPRERRSATDRNPALPGSHARWFGASSLICWQRKAVNHLLRINTPPWTRQPPALLCASLPHRNPNPYRYETPFCCPPPGPSSCGQADVAAISASQQLAHVPHAAPGSPELGPTLPAIRTEPPASSATGWAGK